MPTTSRPRILGGALVAAMIAELVLAAGSFCGALALDHLGTGLGFLALLLLMAAGGLVAALLAHRVLGLPDAASTAAAGAVIIALLPGGPALFYAMGSTGDVARAASVDDLIARRESRYFEIDPRLLAPDRVILEKTEGRAKGDRSDTVYHSFLTPLVDAASAPAAAPRAWLLHRRLHGAKDFRPEEKAREAYSATIRKTGRSFRRLDDPDGFERELSAEPRPLVVTAIASVEDDRFWRRLWVYLVAGLTPLGVLLATWLGQPRATAAPAPRHPYR